MWRIILWFNQLLMMSLPLLLYFLPYQQLQTKTLCIILFFYFETWKIDFLENARISPAFHGLLITNVFLIPFCTYAVLWNKKKLNFNAFMRKSWNRFLLWKLKMDLFTRSLGALWYFEKKLFVHLNFCDISTNFC